MTTKLPSILAVWAVAVVGAILVAVLSPNDEYFSWLTIALASVTLLTFVIQLAVSEKEGLVLRVMASLGGAVLILGVATAVLAFVHA
ncbi:MAG: hypothetical protein JWQ12_1832 [Glaciihabitans sp.]|nr:hypothetical protein [Glaciihabitans sp.]